MKLNHFCLLLFIVGSSNAWWWRKSKPKVEGPEWGSLRVTFMKFNKLPLREFDARKQGWSSTSKCGGQYFAGHRYVLKGDRAVMLLYDSKGKIAGIQMGIAKSNITVKRHPWISEGDHYVITAYFVDPSTICNGKRPISKYIGDRLLIQTGSSINTVMQIPYKQEDLRKTEWVEGRCFYWMGKHYWYKISTDMNCDDFFPVFLLYNNGKLNGFGWNTIGYFESSRYEHPPQRVLKWFFKQNTQPACLKVAGSLTTQHVYFDLPYSNFC